MGVLVAHRVGQKWKRRALGKDADKQNVGSAATNAEEPAEGLEPEPELQIVPISI